MGFAFDINQGTEGLKGLKHPFEPNIVMVIFNDSLLKMSKIKQIYYSLIVTGIEARSRKCL